jgi:hypothetical protein
VTPPERRALEQRLQVILDLLAIAEDPKEVGRLLREQARLEAALGARGAADALASPSEDVQPQAAGKPTPGLTSPAETRTSTPES